MESALSVKLQSISTSFAFQRRLTGHTYRAETRANCHKWAQTEEESLKKWVLSIL